ncbi:neuromedin-U receptor 2-like [Plodia interpunctella]|uniref:neuromedin-U receptor 2-like n=1 Tax=Plodia interpunctella TaxID=58824 RepID=UPI002367ECCA|nr:neuromedin-U receptor 2-like [Plodia interpunctella]
MNASQLLEHFDETHWLHYIQTVEQSDTFHVVYAVSMTVIFCAGMVGNMLTCWVIYRDRSMHTVTNYYLFNLAVSDLVVLLAMLVELTFYFGVFPYPDPWGDVMCKVHGFVVVALWNNGILIMTAVAVERYAAIVHPLAVQGRCVKRRVARVMAAVWSVAVLETLPDVFTMKLLRTRRALVCSVTLSQYSRVVNAVAAVVTFLLPLAVMMYVYIAIAVTVHARQKDSYGNNTFNNNRNNSKKVNKLIFVLTLSFLVCWLPYFSLRLLVAFGGPPLLLVWAQYWELYYEVVTVSAWFSSVLNPLIFSLMSTKFQRALKTLWYATLLRRNKDHVPVLV